MSGRRVTVQGRVYVTLEEVAGCYRVETSWVREVYEYGLLGPGERVGDSTAVPASLLDRVATILRLERQQGLNLAGILRLLDDVTDL